MLLLAFACAPKQNLSEDGCRKSLKNDFSSLVIEQVQSVVEEDTLYLNQMAFKCVDSFFRIKKNMFEKFGMWSDNVCIECPGHNALIWENIELLPNNDKKFYVVTHGERKQIGFSLWVQVFDEELNDMLANDSPYIKELMDFFSDLVRSQVNNRKAFQKEYRKIY